MKLFEPGKIGTMQLKNRIFLAPMGHNLKDKDGDISRESRAYFAERANGGAVIICFGGVVTDKLDGARGTPLSEASINSLEQLQEAVSSYGAKTCIELFPGAGRIAGFLPGFGLPVSASPIPVFGKPDLMCRPPTIDELEELADDLGNAARIAQKAGIDSVMIHAYCGYITDQFMCSLWNKRTDEYGRDLSGRMKLPLDFVKAIRKYCGPDYPIIRPITAFRGAENCPRASKLQRCLKRQLLTHFSLIAVHTSRTI